MSNSALLPLRYLQCRWRPVKCCLKPGYVDLLLIWALCRLLRSPPIAPDIA